MTRVSLGNFSEDDLLDWLGEAELGKGRPLVARVRDLEADEERIRAMVPDTGKKPYLAVARLITLRDGEPMLVSACSCPAGSGCRHAAAMLLRAIEERVDDSAEAEAAPASLSVLSWVEDL